jgi:hypothetical protein
MATQKWSSSPLRSINGAHQRLPQTLCVAGLPPPPPRWRRPPSGRCPAKSSKPLPRPRPRPELHPFGRPRILSREGKGRRGWLNPMTLVEMLGGESTSTVDAHHLFLVVVDDVSHPSTRARSTGTSVRSPPPAPTTSPCRASTTSSSAATTAGACGSCSAPTLDTACFDPCGFARVDGAERCLCPVAAPQRWSVRKISLHPKRHGSVAAAQ